tara:strand:+ start:4894 stop:5037 length:144 start_codon:yes stop_codon:yes gene_type:complete
MDTKRKTFNQWSRMLPKVYDLALVEEIDERWEAMKELHNINSLNKIL